MGRVGSFMVVEIFEAWGQSVVSKQAGVLCGESCVLFSLFFKSKYGLEITSAIGSRGNKQRQQGCLRTWIFCGLCPEGVMQITKVCVDLTFRLNDGDGIEFFC